MFLLGHKQEGRLLEIGCGKGGFLRLAENYFSVEGIDISQYAIDSVKHHFGERIRVANIEDFSIEPARYDVIIAFNLIEHLKRPGEAIPRVTNGLRGDGIFIGSVPYNAKLVGRIVTYFGNMIDRTHISTFSPDTWLKLFKQSGFSEEIFFGEVPFGRNHCRYLFGRYWPHLALNLMFLCKKTS
jgi:2-polyprenyl-3-methyl-5-hydroxy-6-metoxy-1,4-benzoquinol methylase